VWGGDCGFVTDGLRGVFVGLGGGIVCAVDLDITVTFLSSICVCRDWVHCTFSMASLTRGEEMSWLRSRFAISVSLLVPELRHAML
jgi:hypothetical protein